MGSWNWPSGRLKRKLNEPSGRSLTARPAKVIAASGSVEP